MGFDDKWVNWIMWCVTSIQYKVLINGNPQGEITPKRGLRQGDPLSPYLFILCTEALVANIQKAVLEKTITGLQVARSSPPISHLLFADDSLFFCKARKEQCESLLKILENYGLASGQEINFNKSSITFGHKVEIPTQIELRRICGISNTGGMGTYLGLPESLGGAKSKIFAYVQNRLSDRINGWSAKFLSKGGKEILIKSVASAIPTYVMSCFRLPKSITSKLAGAIAKFWWSSGSEQKGMHWIAWSKLCKSKSQGGLSFRTINEFNTALLAKQLWRLMEYPDSLFAKVMKGRYFRDSSPMTDKKIYSPSYGWRSIMSAKSLIKKGLIMRVGSGQSISVWNDPWIPAEQPRPARSKCHILYPALTVDQLVNQSSKIWNLELISNIIDPEDIPLVRGIQISQTYKEDKVGWHYTKSGKYTVKSGYAIEEEELRKKTTLETYGPEIHSLQAQAWKLKCPKKLQHFIWQALTGCLAVMENLNYRGIKCDRACNRCGAEKKTIIMLYLNVLLRNKLGHY